MNAQPNHTAWGRDARSSQQLDSPRLLRNNFDLLRFLFAGTVCLVHAHQLSGFRQLEWIENLLSSAVAVKAFFVVSGFLIFMSFERSSSTRSFAGKRIRRIYPAYFAIIMICALSLVAISSTPAGDYFSSAWLKYVAANLVFLNFLHPTLPGVFDSNKLAAVNGALWTLKIEVMFYIAVPLIVLLMRKLSRLPTLAFLYCASLSYALLFETLAARSGSGMYLELSRQFPGQLSYFIAGAFLYYYLPLFERRIKYFVVAAALILAINIMFPLRILEPFALAVVVAFFGLFLYMGNFGRYGDFSYGVYIVHFPIIQTFLHTGWLSESPGLFLAAVVIATITGSIAMWHGVEKWFLSRGSHYIAASQTPANNCN